MFSSLSENSNDSNILLNVFCSFCSIGSEVFVFSVLYFRVLSITAVFSFLSRQLPRFCKHKNKLR